MEKINFKEKFLNKDFFKLAIKNLCLIAFIITFILLFAQIFGTENLTIGVALIAGLMMFKSIGIGLKQAPFIIFGILFLMMVCNLLSFKNMYLSIFINAIAVFTLMLFSTIRLNYRTYIPFILFYIFAQGTPIPEGREIYRIGAFISSGLMLAIVHFIFNRKDKNLKKISEIFSELNLQNQNYVFTLKMTIGIMIAMFLGDLIGIAKGMWISITVMSLTQPELELTKNRIKWRISGTLIGAIIYLAVFEFILPENSIIFVSFILAYVYTFLKHYQIQMVFITINALNAVRGIFTSGHPIIFRLSFLFLGVLIVLIIVFLENKFFMKKVDSNEENVTKQRM